MGGAKAGCRGGQIIKAVMVMLDKSTPMTLLSLCNEPAKHEHWACMAWSIRISMSEYAMTSIALWKTLVGCGAEAGMCSQLTTLTGCASMAVCVVQYASQNL